MDPNEALGNIRRLANTVVQSQASDASVELAEALDDLDSWLSSGGFLPQDWSR